MTKLTAFLQSQSEDNDEDEDADDLTLMGAPDPEQYKSKSGGILDTLADMQGKAEAQQAAEQKAEATAKFNYDMLAMSLKDQMKNFYSELDDQKKTKAEATEIKSSSEG